MRIFLAEHAVEMIEHVRNSLGAVVKTFDIQQNGDLALQFILSNYENYDLIIIDASLPNIDGAEVCSRVREKDIAVPILMLVSPANLSGESLALSCGADEYLVKPFTEEELRFRVTSLFARTTVFVPALITREDIAFNMRERNLISGDITLQLTMKESALLETLMLRPNEVISKHELVTTVWGENISLTSNRIEVHIKNLRKKLNVFNQAQVVFRIESVRGKGYRFTDK